MYCSSQLVGKTFYRAGDGGVMVSIVAFQAVDPGSIPGHRTFFLLLKTPKIATLFNNMTDICTFLWMSNVINFMSSCHGNDSGKYDLQVRAMRR